jgi:hypothetical protein
VRFVSISTLFVARLAYASRSWLDERMSMHSCVSHRNVVGLPVAGLRQLILVGRWVVEAGLPIFGLSVAGLRQLTLVGPGFLTSLAVRVQHQGPRVTATIPGFLTALAVRVQHQSPRVTATIPGFLTASAVRVYGRRFWWEACLLAPAFGFRLQPVGFGEVDGGKRGGRRRADRLAGALLCVSGLKD